ncbi:galactonate dehydratase [Limosilactobacillus frumenti DSM 13145]|uniref:Galactonate dehydratase n=1 Tax=Limosilactobacillus frumenti DSM 13145 TaxID=1423746 RepID=A0A0R1P3C0_9LACO|nr:mandelate racemase/muconate lactonizing enzyme family protein [Limosilactobacillus frumenti]KRL27104.1 galactonate dehydratase [Limosilactobacillus frumenti DSM 13145]MBA2913792.1 mandelate racemase/muconate lactonizing enzyme family protein [Limosilactobacillus frumenti]QFG72573.1 mandelate racemase/muconate lactonizing enzyme family protein [Limosilactobacillus frumenti]
MKITSVDIIKLNWPGLEKWWHPVCVRINTEDGQFGYGEAGVAYGTGYQGTIGVLHELAHRVIGHDALNINAINRDFYEHTFWAKGGGVIFYSAVSAIDIALWDLKGKHFDVPVYQLLGGQVNHHIRAYASHLEYGWGPFSRYVTKPRDFERLAERAVNQGYAGVKIDPLPQLKHTAYMEHEEILDSKQLATINQRVKAVRSGIGSQRDLITDCHAKLGYLAAKQLSLAMKDQNILYLEEPFDPRMTSEFQKLAREQSIPLATGERLTTALSFQPLIENHAISVAQPDLGNCGGFSGLINIANLAKIHQVKLQLHVCGGPIATAAALQYEAADQNCIYHEEHEINLKEANYHSGKYHYQPEQGFYPIPDRPGIGQELTDKALAMADIVTIK